MILASLACLGLFQALIPSLPFVANADDYMRYYTGGYMAAVALHLVPTPPDLERSVADALATMDAFTASRFLAALTPYSPAVTVQTVLLDLLRRSFALSVPLPLWIIGSATAAIAVWLSWLTYLLRRLFPELSWAWLLMVLAVSTFIHPHTHAFGAEPRSLGVLVTAMAFGLVYLRGRSGPEVVALLALGALLHPYQQLLNVGAQTVILVLIQRERALPRLWDVVLPAVALTGAAYAFTYFVNPLPAQGVSSLLGGAIGGSWADNWAKNGPAAIQVSRYMGPLIAVLMWVQGGPKGALAGLVAVVGAQLLLAGLTDPGPYLGEYPNRLGGACNCVIVTLLLQRDWLAHLPTLQPLLRRAATTVVVLSMLVIAGRMDARYLFVHRLEGLAVRVAEGYDYQPGPSEIPGLALISAASAQRR